jgi:hypothetical protein
MSRKLFGGFLTVTVACLAAYHLTVDPINRGMSDVVLGSIEALSSECTVSSHISANTGFCRSLVNGDGDSCVSTGDSSHPRCNGQIN